MSLQDRVQPAAAEPMTGNEALQLMRLMAAPSAFARLRGDMASVHCDRGGVTLGAGRSTARALQELVAEGLAKGHGAPLEFRLTEAGRALVPRLLSGEQPELHAARRMALAVRQPARDGAPQLVNEAESPLLWLRRRRGRDGVSLIGEAEFAAGERLRADIERARMMPRLTADWERPPSAGFVSAGLTVPEALVAAKARVDKALAAVGPEFSGLLLDICGFLKPIERVEQERGWPARSAKVVIGLALSRLARHYGLANAARGPDRGRLSAWEAAGQKSEFTVGGPAG